MLDPVTQKLREWAREQREEKRDLWEEGVITANSADLYQHVAQNSLAHGECQVLRRIELLDYEDIVGEPDERVVEGSTGE